MSRNCVWLKFHVSSPVGNTLKNISRCNQFLLSQRCIHHSSYFLSPKYFLASYAPLMSLPREPVVQTWSDPQLPSRLDMGAHLQQRAQSFCGTPRPGQAFKKEISQVACFSRSSVRPTYLVGESEKEGECHTCQFCRACPVLAW